MDAEATGFMVGLLLGYTLFCTLVTWLLMKPFKTKENFLVANIISYILLAYIYLQKNIETSNFDSEALTTIVLLAIAQGIAYLFLKDKYPNKENK